MNKKAIAILGAIFLLIVGTLGFLVYSKYVGNKQEPAPTPVDNTSNNTDPTGNNTNPGGNDPTNGQTNNSNTGAVVLLSDDQVVSPVLFYNGSGITYFNKQGQLFQASLEEGSNGQLQLTRKKALDIPLKSNISKILWPARGDNFLAEFKAVDGKKSWSFYNSSLGAYADLPAQIYSLDWMPSGDKILYIWLEKGKATLNQSDPDTSNWSQVAEMWELDDVLHVSPDGKNVLYYEDSSTSGTNQIVHTTPDGKFWKGIVKDGYNFGVLWSPDSQRFLFGKKDAGTQKTQLWYYDLLTGEARDTGLLTVPDKAVWDKDSKVFYAAVPMTGIAGNESLTVDSFYKFDTSSSQQKEYKTGVVSVDGRDLFLSLDSAKLFFKNAQDGALYYLDLNQ